MKTFLARQTLRKAKRKIHQKAIALLRSKMDEFQRDSYKYSIERRVRGFGKYAIKKEKRGRQKAFLRGIGQ